MENQLKPLFLALSARTGCPPRRAYSQPTHKIRSYNRIKINIKRLPTDFFNPSMPDLSPRDISSQQRSTTQEVKRFPGVPNPKDYSTLQKLDSGVPQRAKSYHQRRKKRMVSEHVIEEQQAIENRNILNWTFSRQMFSEQKYQKTKYARKVPPCSPINPNHWGVEENPSSVSKARQKKDSGNCQKVKRILTEKIAELNLNRLKLNLRKNNHPASYLQYIKRVCP